MARSSQRTRWLMVPLAVALAWLVPGAGHAYLGRVWQGAIIFIVVAATFWAGVGMGGVMTVDSVNERWWFIAQMTTGGHGLISYQRTQKVWQTLSKRLNVPEPTAKLVAAQPRVAILLDKELANDGLALVSPTDTVARAYSGVAGMLNLMCIFDALMLALMGAPPLKPPTPSSEGASA